MEPLPRDLAVRLGMPASAQARLAAMPGAADVVLPDDDLARELMSFASVSVADQGALLAARPDPSVDADWWWLLRGAVAELRARMDRPLPPLGFTSWPTVPRDADPIGRFAYAWAFVAVLPEVMAVHRERGIDEQVSRDSVAGLGEAFADHLAMTGNRGIGQLSMWSLPQYLCAVDYTLGRHSFTRAEVAMGDDVSAFALHVHVPAKGALDEASSEASFAKAVEFFAQHYPEEPVSWFTCHSWLLDPQWAQYLRADSNVLRFQEKFDLLPLVPGTDPDAGDRDVLRLGFQLDGPRSGPLCEADLSRVPQTSTLSRAFVAHLRGGGHIHNRTGLRRPGDVLG